LTVHPTPIARQEMTDRFGNLVTHVDFEGVSDHLFIESTFDLDTIASAPLIGPGLPPLPWSFGPGDPMAEYCPAGAQDIAVRDFAAALAAESGWAALPFLHRLNWTLFARMKHDIRVVGAAWTPAQTLAAGGGACRDLTALFMAVCHSLGIAVRFVSGYQAHADTPDGQRHLHAWPETFLPGLGWRGFDPTHGLAVTDGHVALSAAPSQAATMPVDGGFYAISVTATLEYKVRIEAG
jgi:transglutaminase-like putative cysteine protease